ncbi:VanZ family protein [Neobacillus sp. WH10]|uniref:VanZ family protein n=1 Tax=Neobacillus sp. WH10 TaxID=3047873 RepID=UPI0024C11367|nr:VanZ family protein [Neobacillus sp. WH10]WHY78441.1 VanZ family protein [Neobacillus sp. WH10]
MKNNSPWLSIGLSQLLFVVLLPVWLRLLSYLHPVVLVVVWMCLTIVVFFLVYYVRKETIHISKNIIKSVISIYSLGLLVLLFFRPANQDYSQVNFVPFKTIVGFLSGNGDFLIAFYNLTANVLLFVPYGVVTFMLYKSPSRRQLFLIPAGVIFLIETIQHLTKRGSMDIDDFILNLLGVWIGYALYPVIQKVVKVKGSRT